MDYEEFVGQFQQHASIASSDDATRIIRATFETLAERMTSDDSGDLASQLPEELADFLFREPDSEVERFPMDEFFRRVAARADLPPNEAEPRVRTLFQVLGDAIANDELEDLRPQLPKEFHSLMQRAKTPLL